MEEVKVFGTGTTKSVLTNYDLAGGTKTTNYIRLSGLFVNVLIDATNVVGDILVKPVVSSLSGGSSSDFSEVEVDVDRTISSFVVTGGTKRTVPYHGASNIFFAVKILPQTATGTVSAYITV